MAAAGKRAAAVILCAGKGSRMNDDSRSKVCFDCAGVPVIRRIVANMRAGGVDRFTIVVGHQADSVMACLCGEPGVTYAYQREQKGTGHAALCGLETLADLGYEGPVIVSMGDKIVESSVVADLLAAHPGKTAVWAVQPAACNASGGRIAERDGTPCGIVEFADAALMSLAGVPEGERAARLAALGLNPRKAAAVLEKAAEREPEAVRVLAGREFTAEDLLAAPHVNAALCRCDASALREALASCGADNAQGEIYLTDAFGRFAEDGRLAVLPVENPALIRTYSTRPELRAMSRAFLRTASELRRAIAGGEMRARFEELYPDRPVAEEARWCEALAGFERAYGDRRVIVARAPCRVNLMGRHVEHRGGGINVFALDRDTLLVTAPRDGDDFVNAVDADPAFAPGSFSISRELALGGAAADWEGHLAADAVRAALEASRGNWINYLKAAVLRFAKAVDVPLSGMDVYVHGNVPVAAGLSSSSALVVAAAEAVTALNCLNFSERAFVELCGEGEWFVGSRGGSGDHAAMKCSRANAVTHLDFAPFAVGERAPFSGRYAVLAVNSLESSKKSEGSRDRFNARVASYEFALMLLKKAFPDRPLAVFRDLANLRPWSEIWRMICRLPERVTRAELRAALPECGERLGRIFATHADPGEYDLRGVTVFGVAECTRSARFMDLLAAGNYAGIGALMRTSHAGDALPGERYGDDELSALAAGNADPAGVPGAYRCSTPKIDALCARLQAMPGVLGASIAGAGLGGCVLVLAERAALGRIRAAIDEPVIVCRPSEGSGVVY